MDFKLGQRVCTSGGDEGVVAEIEMVDGQVRYRLRHSWGALALAWHAADQLRAFDKAARPAAAPSKPKAGAKTKTKATGKIKTKARPKS